MKFPWTKAIERRIQNAVAEATPAIASRAIDEATPLLLSRAKEEIAAEFVRAIRDPKALQSKYDLNGQIPSSYPQVGGSPYPLFGYDNPVWYSTPNNPKRKPQSVVDVDTIRRFANTYDVLRSCINHLKRELQAQPFIIVPKDRADKSEATKSRIAEAEYFFSARGGLGDLNETRRHYEAKIFEDVLVIGAFASWKNRARNGKLLQVVPIDAATIRPRMDAYGWPGPGEDWYEQWIMGMRVTGFRHDELTYDGLHPVTHSPWFQSPVEWLISAVLSALKADEWNRTWLTDGNTPDTMISTPETWTPEMITTYSEFFNGMLAGNTAARRKAMFIPGGAKEVGGHSRKDQEFQEFELWLLRRTCAMYGVQPASIGFAGEQYKVSQENSTDATTQFGTGALVDLRKEHYDDLLMDLGFPDLEIVRPESAEEIPLDRAKRLQIQVGGPWMTVNEARQEDGLDPTDEGDALLVGAGVRRLTDIDAYAAQELSQGKEADDENEDADADQDLNRWMRKAINRVRASRPALCPFESDSIDPSVAEQIAEALSSAKTVADVRRAFSTHISTGDPKE